MSTQHMRLAGHARVFVLTDDAHAELLDYLDRARTALCAEPESDETLRDLEASIGDHLEPFYATPDTAVDEDQMLTILDQAGAITPDPASHPQPSPQRGPFWARITEGKWLGGACLGIAARGGFDAAWVRGISVGAAFLVAGVLAPLGEGIPMLLFIAATVLGYLVLLLALPPIKSVREYQRISGTAVRG
ncbi:PspC domain-containing protein [Nocardioides sp. zg-DK7169]|uniref:PspC domain-containing protein n=1 Tax=Nocardioides sp. zg-DK7169 TaxID=2736600 RepID=UPI0015554619|nr:PspC domain-containing protein [Nocardioides sp. zg-DK7169]NPC95522.1 PspC domain-containing protein [Nocardioides sp. zg-DK7169]